jgi:CIC family chloride channel protein
MFTLQRRLAVTYLSGMAAAAAFGAVGALAAQFFRWGLEAASKLLFASTEDVSRIFAELPWYLRIATPALGGLIAGLVLMRAQRVEGRGEPHADYLETIDGRVGRIPFWSSFLRCLSSFFSIVSGGSVGKEGAMVQLSSTVASALAARIGIPEGERFRLAIALAATGGLAAVYHTPLAAAIFIAEIAFGGIEPRRMGLLFTAAVASTWVVSVGGNYEPLYNLPPYGFDVTGQGVLAVIVIGVATGACGTVFLSAIRGARTLFAHLHANVAVRMVLGGLIVGVITLVSPEVTGNGFAPIATLLSGGQFSSPVVVLLALKILATAATVGAGAVGGLFTPSLLIGALTGAVCAPWLTQWLQLPDAAVMFGVVGMGAALAATTQAPIMSTLMVFEMTREPTFIFPLMLASVFAYATAHALGQLPTYAVIDRHQARSASRSSLYDTTAGIVMSGPGGLAASTATIAAALDIGLRQKNRFVFVVDDAGHFVGAVYTQELMAQANAGHGADATLPQMANRDFPVVYAQQKLFDIWETVVNSPAERTPVLDSGTNRKVVGMLQKSELLKQARALFA